MVIPMPDNMGQILYGSIAHLYIREAVSACREVISSAVPVMIDALVHAAYKSSSFSDLLLEELLKQYQNVSSGELKNLSSLLIDVLALDDGLQGRRIDQAIYGNKSSSLIGLLQLVDQQHATDSCRTYQCIKTLVVASQKSPMVKDKLLEDPGKWQWAVNWLKDKMDSDNANDKGSSLISASSEAHGGFDTASNEDSLSRNFHRTTSAVVTLAEANAILAEFDSPMDDSNPLEEEGTASGNSSKRLDEDEEMPDLLDMKDWKGLWYYAKCDRFC